MLENNEKQSDQESICRYPNRELLVGVKQLERRRRKWPVIGNRKWQVHERFTGWSPLTDTRIVIASCRALTARCKVDPGNWGNKDRMVTRQARFYSSK
jgi:hypothetical protein